MRVAILQASHWHYPLYEPGLIEAGVEVVAVSDHDPAVAEDIAARHGASAFDDDAGLIARRGFDFAFVFGRPREMPQLASSLIEHGIPFSLEKPCGRTAEEVAGLRRAADARGLFAAVPLIQRIGPVGRLLHDAFDGDEITSLSFRFIAGPPERYRRAGCAWMLDPIESGGGAAINLAVHFVDLVHVLTGSRAASIHAQTGTRLHGLPVEDHAVIALKLESGADVVIEAGYGFPDAADKREFRLSVIGRRAYVQSTPDGARITPRDGGPAREIAIDFDTDAYYARYVTQVLGDLCKGRPPIARLADMQAALDVIDAVYSSASRGGTTMNPSVAGKRSGRAKDIRL